jgi:hypothetical protein
MYKSLKRLAEPAGVMRKELKSMESPLEKRDTLTPAITPPPPLLLLLLGMCTARDMSNIHTLRCPMTSARR